MRPTNGGPGSRRGMTGDVIADHIRHPGRRRHQTARVATRFVLGRDLDGKRRTDARWSSPGTQTTEPYGQASRWASQTHRRRAKVRNGALVGLFLLVAGGVVSPADTATTVRVMVWLLGAALVWVVVEKCRRWSHVQTYIVRPAAGLADMLGIPRRTDPRLWVHVPTDHRTNPDKQVTIDLLGGYTATAAQQKHHASVAAKLFHMDSPDWGINYESSPPVMWFRACPQPPQLVLFEQVRELAEATPYEEFLFGLGSRMSPFSTSLTEDSPHVLASMGPGGGKSQFGKWMALQAIRKGSRVMIIDIVKRGASHKWAKGVRGVEIYRTPAAAHTALLELSELVETRCESYWNHGETGDDQQVLLIIEESNRTIRKLQSYWTLGLGQTKTSEAVLAIEGILCVGREAKVNAVTFGQRMSAQASGGGDARETYGVRVGNRYSRQTARMLFDCNPLPPSPKEPGRVQVVIGQTATQIQLPYLPDDDPAPLEWALAGAQVEVGESGTRTVRDLGKPADSEVGKPARAGITHLTVVPDPSQELVTLSQAAVRLEMPRKALANARDRDPEFPASRGADGQTLLYRMAEISRWAPNRERRGDVTGGAS